MLIKIIKKLIFKLLSPKTMSYCIRSIGSDDIWTIAIDGLDSKSRIVSAGVGKAVSFEVELIRLFGCEILVFDPSETGSQTAQMIDSNEFKFEKIGLSNFDGLVSFSNPDNINEGSLKISNNSNSDYRLECISLQSIMKRNEWGEIDLLKMDIEGFEYNVLDSVIKNSIKVKQICVEFHTNRFMDIDKRGINLFIILVRLYFNGYRLIHKVGYDYTLYKK